MFQSTNNDSFLKKFIKLIFSVAAIIILVLIGNFLYQCFRDTSELEKQIVNLEKEVKKQETVIIEKRIENDNRVKTKVQEKYQEIENMTDDEVDSKWDEFMMEVRKRNNERKNNCDNVN